MAPVEVLAACAGWGGVLVGACHAAGFRGVSPGRMPATLGATAGLVAFGAAAPGPVPLVVGLPLAVAATLAGSASARRDPDRPFRDAARPVGEGRARLGPSTARVGYAVAHGGGNDRFYGLWYLYERMLATGAALELVELPGHGRGGADPFSLDAGRARIDAAVASLRADTERVVLLGQSLGGAFSLDAAARGVPVDAVVSVSAPHTLAVGGAVVREARALFGAGLYRTLRYGTVREVLPAVGTFRRAAFPVRGTNDYVATFRAALLEMDLLATLPRATAPIFVAHGDWDGVVPFVQAERIAAAAPTSTLRRLRGRTHLDPLLDRPTVDALLAWAAPEPA